MNHLSKLALNMRSRHFVESLEVTIYAKMMLYFKYVFKHNSQTIFPKDAYM